MTDAIQKYQAEIDRGLVSQAQSVRIVTDEDYQEAAEVARQIKTVIDEIEEKRKEITKPMNEALDRTNALFKTVKQKYVEAEQILKAKLSAHLEAAKELEAEVLQNTTTHDALAVAPLAAPVAEGVSSRTYYHAEVVDPDLVPDTFWVIDEKALNAYVRSTKGKVPVPGVRIVKKNSVALTKK